MHRPSKKWTALAVTAGLMISSVAVFAGDEKVIYNQSNVGISSAVDRYVEKTVESEATVAKTENSTEKIALSTAAVKDDKISAAGSKAAVKASTESTTEATTAATTAATTEAATEATDEITFTDTDEEAIVIADEYLNVRKDPSTEADILAQLSTGTTCRVKKQGGGWSYITAGEVEGYVFSGFLKIGDEAEKWAEQYTGKVAVITGEGLRLRSAADINSDVLTYLPQGQTYKVLGYEGDWTRLEIDYDLQGYVSNEFIEVVDKGDDDAIYQIRVKLFEENTNTTEEETTEDTQSSETETVEATTEEVTEAVTEEETTEEVTEAEEETESSASSDVPYSSKGEEVVAFAVQFVGNPYVYGGSSLTNGADCSGFTMAVYEHFGYSLPHGATPQAYCGVEVSLDSIMPGDLLFYGSDGVYGHVTIYMGGGQVVHASTEETGIKISPYDYRTPAKAVRIIY